MRVVYSATRADVVTTVIDGRVVMRDRSLLTVDKPVVLLQESNRAIRRLLNRIETTVGTR